MTFLGPKHILGIAELSHRFALVTFPLMLGFFNTSKRISMAALSCLALIAVAITIGNWLDYERSSALISRRNDFLESVVKRGQPILTFDDDLGEAKAHLLPLVPKGVSFTFQSDYLIMSNGYNPFSFYTGFLLPRDTFISQFYELTKSGRWEDQTLKIRGSDIPKDIGYVILDTGSEWGYKMADALKQNFIQLAEMEIADGITTIVLQRAR